MRARVLIAAVLVLAGLGGVTAGAEATCANNGPGFQPADGKTLLTIGNAPDDVEFYEHGISLTGGAGKAPGGTMSYTGIKAPYSMAATFEYEAQR
ncbi:MAG TPA: hypothetical protein VMY34_10850, partial [Acidimicrobiales bacterium]|nr:hypothetical protein [Acidimicrobiales bacterium]